MSVPGNTCQEWEAATNRWEVRCTDCQARIGEGPGMPDPHTTATLSIKVGHRVYQVAELRFFPDDTIASKLREVADLLDQREQRRAA